MRRIPRIIAAALVMGFPMLTPVTSAAMQLDFPRNATLSSEDVAHRDSYLLPVSPWENGAIKTIEAKGEVTQQAWKISASGLTSLQILEPLKQQLIDAGFKVIFECETIECGGFDFRFEIPVMPEPLMHVDLGDYRFLAARRLIDQQPEYFSLLVSRSQNAGYIQLVRVGVTAKATELVTSTKNPAMTTDVADQTGAPLADLPLAQALEETSHYILSDLLFETGSSELGVGDFTSLAALADYLQANPTRTVALVGHTDAEGSLAGNIALSKKRATSVVQRLVSEHGVNKIQLSAEGNGFLSPLASNLTEGGRAQNRRVEVIITSTQ